MTSGPDRENWGRDIRKSADPAYYNELKLRAIYNRKHPTESERLMWYILNGNEFLGFKFRRQHIIDKYIVDFVCLSKKLIIEIDGGYHSDPNQKLDDQYRTSILERYGYHVIRFTNRQVAININEIISIIKQHLK